MSSRSCSHGMASAMSVDLLLLERWRSERLRLGWDEKSLVGDTAPGRSSCASATGWLPWKAAGSRSSTSKSVATFALALSADFRGVCLGLEVSVPKLRDFFDASRLVRAAEGEATDTGMSQSGSARESPSLERPVPFHEMRFFALAIMDVRFAAAARRRAMSAFSSRSWTIIASFSHSFTSASGKSSRALRMTVFSRADFHLGALKAFHSHTSSSWSRGKIQRSAPARGPSSSPNSRSDTTLMAMLLSSFLRADAMRFILLAASAAWRPPTACRSSPSSSRGADFLWVFMVRSTALMRAAFFVVCMAASCSCVVVLILCAPVICSSSATCLLSSELSNMLTTLLRRRSALLPPVLLCILPIACDAPLSWLTSRPRPVACCTSSAAPKPAWEVLRSSLMSVTAKSASCISRSVRLPLRTHLVMRCPSSSSSTSFSTASILRRRGGNMTMTAERMTDTFCSYDFILRMRRFADDAHPVSLVACSVTR
mmetsp:Transcript_13130/g.33048  ORF Transcript_13130/g.33048 Transcript_13130/m.33048 type:complete len:485 (-) Transcript_13130:1418-2872(-)